MSRTERFNNSKFVQRELSREEAATLKSHPDDEAAALDTLAALLDKGYKLSMRRDERTNAYACWLIGGPGDAPNPDCILPGRGSTPYKALKQVLFKHFEILDEMWSQALERTSLEEIDD